MRRRWRPFLRRVLARNGDDLLLLSEFALEAKQFGSNGYWDKCELREWLNGDFYGASFSEEEKASVQKMMTSDITEDHVFLLSWEEAGGLLPGPEDRIAYSTSGGNSIGGFAPLTQEPLQDAAGAALRRRERFGTMSSIRGCCLPTKRTSITPGLWSASASPANRRRLLRT